MKHIDHLKLLMVFAILLTSQFGYAQDTANRNDQNTWQVNPANYQNSMIITAVINIEGDESRDADDKVAAFQGISNNIRGVATPVYIPALDRYMVSLFVYSSNGAADDITFQVYDAGTDLVLPCTTVDVFETDGLHGNFAMPDTIFTIRIKANISKDDVLCAADNNGFAKANVGGGTPPYNYLWSTGSTADSIGGLFAGEYFLTITDASGFNKIDSVEILNLNRPIESPTLASAPDNLVCEGQDVYLFAFSSETEAPVYEWYDNFGTFIQEGTSLYIPDIDVSRQYDVQTNVRNCISAVSTIDIAVQAVPDANFGVSNFEPTPQEAIVFTPVSSNEPVTFEWDFGDGNTSMETTPTHTYAAAGNYVISLTITTLEDCSQTVSEFISVDERQVDVLVEMVSPNCALDPSGSISIQAINGVPPYTFAWDTGDNTAQITGLTAGSYGLTVTDALGNTAERAIELTAIDNLAPAEVAINGGSVICPGDDVLLAAFSSDEEVDFRWYNDALGTQLLSVGEQLTLFGLSTNRTIWVETRRGDCTSAAFTQVDLAVESVEADFVISTPAVPINSNITFTANNNIAGNTYTWDFGDGTTATGAGPVNHDYTIAGTFEVSLEVGSPNGCSNSAKQFVNVWGGALQLLPVVQNADCAGNASGAISLQILNGQAPFNYQWSTGSIQPALNQLLPGIYGITVTDAAGLSATAQITLGENGAAPNAPTLIVNGGNTICAGDDTWINAYSDNSEAIFYWYQSAVGGNPLHVGNTLFLFGLDVSANYYVESRIGDCNSGRTLVNVQVNDPDASFTASSEVVFVDQPIQFAVENPTFGMNYNWDWADNTPNSALTFIIHSFDVPGIYEVTLTARSLITACQAEEVIRIQVLDIPDTGGNGEDAPLQALPLAEPAQCTDSPSGQLSAFAFGGQPPYSYQWSNGISQPFQTAVVPGNYFLTVTDGEGNEAVGSAVVGILNDFNAPVAVVNGGQAACIGEPVWLGASSEDPNATFRWYADPSDPDPIYVGQSIQVYSQEAMDTLYLLSISTGCISDITPVIIELGTANADFTLDPATAEVGQTVDFMADSISISFDYEWSFGDGQTDNGVNVTTDYDQPGLYEAILEVTSEAGCVASQRRFVTVYEPGGELYLTFTLNNPHCPEDETGSITALVFGGVPPYTYAWSNGATTESTLGVGVGAYSLIVTDAVGQTAESSTQLQSLQSSILAPEVAIAGGGIACAGGDTWLGATGGTPGTQYYWYDAPAGGTLNFIGSYLELDNVQGAQTFFVEAQYEGCISTNRTSIFVGLEAVSAAFETSATVIPESATVDFNALDVVGSQTYDWDFGDGTFVSGTDVAHAYASAGYYTVNLTVRSANGCEDVQSRIIRVLPLEALQLSANVQGARCADGTDGSIQLSLSGGVPPYVINWDGGNNMETLSDLAPGDYNVTVTDNAGNQITQTIEVGSELPAITIDEAIINGGSTICPGESVVFVAAANVANADYRWYDAATGGELLYVGASFPSAPLYDNLSVFVEARAGVCQTASRIELLVSVEGPAADFSVSPDMLLSGEEATFTPNNQEVGSTYVWNFGDDQISTEAIPTHTYSQDGIYLAELTITDANGCSVSEQRTVNVGFGLELGVVLDATDVQCEGDDTGAVLAQVVNGTPPYTFEWSNGQTGSFLQGLPQGDYEVTITDALGETTIAQTTINSLVTEVPGAEVVANNSIICSDEYLILYAYDDSGVATNFYWYDSPSGGNLLGTGSNYSQQGLNSNTQTFYVQAANGVCRSEEIAAITINEDSPNASFTASTNAATAGNVVNFTPFTTNPDYTYEWSFGDGGTSALMMPSYAYNEPGQYTVTLSLTSDLGCTESLSENAFIEVVPEGALSIIFSTIQVECDGDNDGSISVDVINGVPPFDYQWSTGASTSTINNLTVGTYTVTITDNDGNSSIKATEIAPLYITPPAPTVSPDNSGPLCLGQDVILTASSGQQVDQYYWYAGIDLIGTGFSIVITPDDDNVLLTVQGQRGSCFSNPTNIAYDVQSVEASFDLVDQALAGEAVSFTPDNTNYAVYEWDFGDGNSSAEMSPQHSYAQEGQYEVSLWIESQEGCFAEVSNIIEIFPVNEILLNLDTEDVLCAASETGTVTAQVQGGLPPYDFLWSNGATGSTITNLAAGLYSLTVTDSEGNDITGSAEVENMDVPIPTPTTLANGGAPVCKGEQAFLSAEVLGYSEAEIFWYANINDNTPIEIGDVLLVPGLQENTTFYTESLVDNCPSERVAVEVEIQAPVVTFSIDPDTELNEGDLVQFIPDVMESGNTYYWQFGDNGWSTGMTPYYFYNLPGTFDVELEVVDSDGCSDQLMKEEWITVLPYQGLQGEEIDERAGQLEGSEGITGRVFPNPFTDYLTSIIKVSKTGYYQLELIDAYGRVIVKNQSLLNEQTHNWQLDLSSSNLQPGFYFLRLIGEGEQAMTKLIKH